MSPEGSLEARVERARGAFEALDLDGEDGARIARATDGWRDPFATARAGAALVFRDRLAPGGAGGAGAERDEVVRQVASAAGAAALIDRLFIPALGAGEVTRERVEAIHAEWVRMGGAPGPVGPDGQLLATEFLAQLRVASLLVVG